MYFWGRGYGDSPEYIAEEIIRQGLPYDLVWLVQDMNTEVLNRIVSIR